MLRRGICHQNNLKILNVRSHKSDDAMVVCRSHNFVRLSFMTYHRNLKLISRRIPECKQWNMNCLPLRSSRVHSQFQWISRCSIIRFLCRILQIIVSLFFHFRLVLVLSALLLTTSDYLSGAFKLILIHILIMANIRN